MLKSRFYGVTSLLLVGLAMGVGLAAIWQIDKSAAALYVLCILVGVPLILYAYCAKCEIRLTGCRHVLPGQVTRLLPARQNEPYTFFDYMGLGLPMLVLVVFPQPWLLGITPLFMLFWACLAGGLVQILLRVCNGCGNRKCLLCRLRN